MISCDIATRGILRAGCKATAAHYFHMKYHYQICICICSDHVMQFWTTQRTSYSPKQPYSAMHSAQCPIPCRLKARFPIWAFQTQRCVMIEKVICYLASGSIEIVSWDIERYGLKASRVRVMGRTPLRTIFPTLWSSLFQGRRTPKIWRELIFHNDEVVVLSSSPWYSNDRLASPSWG